MNKVLIGLLGLFYIASAMAFGCIQWPADTYTGIPQSNGTIAPSWGLYWVKMNNPNPVYMEAAAKAYTPDNDLGYNKTQYLNYLEKNHYFNPNYPTIIFIHGWQPYATKAKRREDFCYSYPGGIGVNDQPTVYNTLAPWQHWNVAIFYWNQFADEVHAAAAEAKIYTTKIKPFTHQVGMRWKYVKSNGDTAYSYANVPKNKYGQEEDVSDMLYQAYSTALPKNYTGGNIHQLRIAGHSLGAQLAILLTYRIANGITDGENPHLPLPSRIVLLDPYFSLGKKSYLNDLTIPEYDDAILKQTENMYRDMGKQLAVSEYRTSRISYFPTGDSNQPLEDVVAYTRLYPEYIKFPTTIDLHHSATFLYFQSMEGHPYNYWPYINATSNQQAVLSMMGKKNYQVAGMKDFNPELDQFAPFRYLG